jgi:hypothetical protein
MSDNHQLIAVLARERHQARYEDRVMRRRSARGGQQKRRATMRARAGWLLVGIGLRLAVSDRGAPETALIGR